MKKSSVDPKEELRDESGRNLGLAAATKKGQPIEQHPLRLPLRRVSIGSSAPVAGEVRHCDTRESVVIETQGQQATISFVRPG